MMADSFSLIPQAVYCVYFLPERKDEQCFHKISFPCYKKLSYTLYFIEIGVYIVHQAMEH